jgi:predicted DNA binding CopG/RHH family protein
MSKKTVLDSYEQDIEDNFERLQSITNLEKEKAMLKETAKNHVKRKKSITIRISEIDLEAMQIKASKLGIPYQTYINMLIHKDAVSGF